MKYILIFNKEVFGMHIYYKIYGVQPLCQPAGRGGKIGKKKAPQFPEGLNLKSATTYSPTFAVPSALAGLTSLFGMGRGGTLPL